MKPSLPILLWFGGIIAALFVSHSAVIVAITALVLGPVCLVIFWSTAAAPALAAHQDLTREATDLATSLGAQPTDQPSLIRALAEVRASTPQRLDDLTRRLTNATHVLEAAPWPMLATNAQGEVVAANRAAAEFFQRSYGLIGRGLEDLVTQREILTLHAAALKGVESEGQARIQRSDGTRIFQVHAAPLKLLVPQEQTGAVVSLRDITELATALQLKTDFVANASHELRTPLASIKAAAETLSDGAWDDPAMRAKLVQVISGNVGRLEEMVRDLLDLSRLESPEAPVQFGPVSLPDIAATLQDEFEPLAKERSLTLCFEFAPDAQQLRSDPKLLTLILKNLIDNATKFANEGTTVRITATRTKDGVRIQVIDRGVGIPLAQQQRVFERFFQVDPARTGFSHRRGTGLGLAIVKHAVKALGGTIGVESVWKQGTTMTVDLPG